MEKLFGIPIDQLVATLLVAFGVGVGAMAVVALRNRTMFRVGARNIPRRRSQTVLIVLGLMLATLLFSAAFTAGDTLNHSIRALVLRDLGQVDVAVQAQVQEASGRPVYFDQSAFEAIRRALTDDPRVEGVAPMVREYAPVVGPAARLSEPWVPILGIAEEWTSGFDRLVDGEGQELHVSALASDQVYISGKLAEALEVGLGDTVLLFLGTEPTSLQVAGLYQHGGHPAGEFSLALPMARLQMLTDHAGKITQVLINNRGDALEGAAHSPNVLSALAPLLEGSELEAQPWKQDALDEAEANGNSIATIFFTFAQFSVAAGILLIFLLFVMLAAERKRELGIARAVGTQRSHVIQMFSFEGAIYALLAAGVGSLLGVGVGLAMVRVMGFAITQSDFELVFAVRWHSVVLAYVLGMALTFAVVLFSSWRVSRLNIVRAIRDLPEPTVKRKSLKSLVFSILVTGLGILLATSGYQSEQASPFGLGVSLTLIGVPLVARWLGLPDRLAFSVSGLGLVAWWLAPSDIFGLPDMEQGIEMFFVSGIMLVLGAVWTVMYNSDLLVALLVRLLGRGRGLAPVIKTAMAFPMQHRLRTGITLAMFSLIVFTLTMMGFIIKANDTIWENAEQLSGGFHVRAYANPINPIPDMRAALAQVDDIDLDDIEAIGSFAWASIRIKQEGTEHELVDWWVRGHDAGYANNVTHKFALMAEAYDSATKVWQALQNEPGTAIVGAFVVPTKNKFNLGASTPELQLEGVFLEDAVLPEITLLVQDPRTGREQPLRVIGVLDSVAGYSAGVMVSQETLNGLVSQQVPPNNYMFRLKEGVDAEAAAKAIEAGFLEHGLQAVVILDEVREGASVNRLMNTLLQGFMSLGLVVGIAALGVIAARSVVERRQQIGILRSLGFQKGMVQLSFLLESSFIALLGIAIGVLLGTMLSYRLVEELSADMEGLTFRVPWLNIAVVIILAYGSALLTTLFPARQAAKVYPAQALRFE